MCINSGHGNIGFSPSHKAARYLKSEKFSKLLMKFPIIWYIVCLCRSNFGSVFWIWMWQYFLHGKFMNILLFPKTIFLRFISYLLWFSSLKKLLYTKLTQMLWGFSRTWQFLDTCSRTRVMGSEASPLFFGTPLICTQHCPSWVSQSPTPMLGIHTILLM